MKQRNDSGVSATSTKGKLKVLQSHYQRLGSCSVDDASANVTVLVLCVCLCVRLPVPALAASAYIYTCNQLFFVGFLGY